MSNDENTTIDKLEAIGGRIVSKIVNILRWIIVLSPIAATGFIWVYGFLVIIGINVFAIADWTVFGVEPLFILSKTNKPYIQIAWASITISTLPALLVAAKLLKKDYVPLRAINARSGTTGVWKLPPQRFESISVVDYNENELGRDGLHKIDFSDGKIGYEADEYDPKTNTAKTSWYVGLAPKDVRERKHSIDDIRGEFAALVNAALDTIGGKSRAAREAGAAEVNEAIQVRERLLQSDKTPQTPLEDYIDDKQPDIDSEEITSDVVQSDRAEDESNGGDNE